MTSSLVGFPVTTRNVNLANEEGKLYVDTRVNFLDSIDYIDEKTGKNIENVQEYAFNNHLSKDSINVILSENTIDFFLDKIISKGGVKATLAGVLKVEESKLNDTIVEMLTKRLPKNEDDALAISFLKCNFGLFYNEIDNCIYLKQKVKNKWLRKTAVEIKVSINEVKNLLDNLYADLDESVINNPKGISKIFDKIAKNTVKYKIDGTNTAYDYYKNGYFYHKVGESAPDEMIESSTGLLKKNTKYAKKFLDKFFLKSIRKDMVKLVENSELELDKVFMANNDNFTTKSIVKLITSKFKNLGDVWNKVARISLVPDKVVTLANKVMIYIIEGLVVDTDVVEDNDFSAIMNLQ
jgi:hypothetical protein